MTTPRPKGRQARLLEAQGDHPARDPRRRARSLHHPRLRAGLDPQHRGAGRVQPRRHLRLLRLEGRDLLRARRRGAARPRRARAGRRAERRSGRGRARVGVAALRVQQGAAAVFRAGVPRSARAAREPRVRALRVHLGDAQPRARARGALHRRRAVSAHDARRGGAAAAVGAGRRHSPRCGCRSRIPESVRSTRSCATPSRRRLPASARARRGMRGQPRPPRRVRVRGARVRRVEPAVRTA